MRRNDKLRHAELVSASFAKCRDPDIHRDDVSSLCHAELVPIAIGMASLPATNDSNLQVNYSHPADKPATTYRQSAQSGTR